MPLDSGSSNDVYVSPSWDDDRPPVSLADAVSLSAGLKAAREASGRTLDDLAEATRVRRQYLVALEEGQYDQLPSRPFSTGYVRAYARALGLDEETAADRFKAESPDATHTLRAPVGSELDDVKPRATPWIVGAGVLLSAVVLWNVAQHAMGGTKLLPTDFVHQVQERWTLGTTPGQAFAITAPLPAPKDQSVPPPYIPPGLEKELGATAGAQQAPAGPGIPVGAAFNPKGAIYGAAPNESNVTVQALKPLLVVLRSPDGATVRFAKQLAPGESYRAPLNSENMLLDVSEPSGAALYFNGENRGLLSAQVTPLSQLNNQAAQLEAAAQAQAARQAAAQAAAQPPAPAPAAETPTGA